VHLVFTVFVKFINNKYICLILPNQVNNQLFILYVPYQRSTQRVFKNVLTAEIRYNSTGFIEKIYSCDCTGEEC